MVVMKAGCKVHGPTKINMEVGRPVDRLKDIKVCLVIFISLSHYEIFSRPSYINVNRKESKEIHANLPIGEFLPRKSSGIQSFI